VLLLAGVLVWNARQVLDAGAGSPSLGWGGGLGGTLLGPEESGGPCDPVFGWWGVAGFFVVVWLLDSGREHLCSCFAQIMFALVVWGWGWSVFVVFVCVATSYEGRMVDALASRADEGRRSLR
jgi:hypothetical protein